MKINQKEYTQVNVLARLGHLDFFQERFRKSLFLSEIFRKTLIFMKLIYHNFYERRAMSAENLKIVILIGTSKRQTSNT